MDTTSAATTVTVHDLAADWGWMDAFDTFRIGRKGRVEWEQAEYTDPQMRRVKVSRFAPQADGSLRVKMAYLPPDTTVTMVARRARL